MADEDAVRDDRRNTETDANGFQTDDLKVGLGLRYNRIRILQYGNGNLIKPVNNTKIT